MAAMDHVLKQFYPFITTQDPMSTLSAQDKFVFDADGFQVRLPNPASKDEPYLLYHRALVSELRPHVLPMPRLTRGGNISSHQPEPAKEQPYTYYLAQLIHYGLDFEWSKDTAKLSLAKAILAQTLRVPKDLIKLEKRLKVLWKEEIGDTIRVGDSDGEEVSDEDADDHEEVATSSETTDTEDNDENESEESDQEAIDVDQQSVSSHGIENGELSQSESEVVEDGGIFDDQVDSSDDTSSVDDEDEGDDEGDHEDDNVSSVTARVSDSPDTEDVASRTSSQSKQLGTRSHLSTSRRPARIPLRPSIRNASNNLSLVPGESAHVLGKKRKYMPAKPASEISSAPSKLLGQTEAKLPASRRRKSSPTSQLNASLDQSVNNEQTPSKSRKLPEIRTARQALNTSWIPINGRAAGGKRVPRQAGRSSFAQRINEMSGQKQNQRIVGLSRSNGHVTKSEPAKNRGKIKSNYKFPSPFQSASSKPPQTVRELKGVMHGRSSGGMIDGANDDDHDDHDDRDSEWADWDLPLTKKKRTT